MSSTNGSLSAQDQDSRRFQALLAEYAFAYENRSNADSVAWEMTSIMWGGQTLLLGFALEAVGSRPAQPIIVVLAMLGIALSFFNSAVMGTRITVSREMVKVCSEIEDTFPETFKPQRRIDSLYPSKTQTFWFNFINISLSLVWIVVGLRAGFLYLNHCGQ